MIDRARRQALLNYGDTLVTCGWKAAEKVIAEYETKWPDFRSWAYALGIVLRADELLHESTE